MNTGRSRNMAASARRRLIDLAHQRGDEPELVFVRYALERLLYRLSRSSHRDQFVLKGAMLFSLWSELPHRPTRDIDLLGRGESSIDRLVTIFRDVVAVPVEDDGLSFAPETVQGSRIKEDQDYEGVRVQLQARMGTAVLSLQVDIGFGDAVTPEAAEAAYPTLLDLPAPVLRVYPKETVVAEKYQALVALGLGTSRMKDFYDLWVLARTADFDGALLCRAIRATFERRQTPLPRVAPMGLTQAFASDPSKQAQWRGFLRRSRLAGEGIELAHVIEVLEAFLMPPTAALLVDDPFDQSWLGGGPWTHARD